MLSPCSFTPRHLHSSPSTASSKGKPSSCSNQWFWSARSNLLSCSRMFRYLNKKKRLGRLRLSNICSEGTLGLSRGHPKRLGNSHIPLSRDLGRLNISRNIVRQMRSSSKGCLIIISSNICKRSSSICRGSSNICQRSSNICQRGSSICQRGSSISQRSSSMCLRSSSVGHRSSSICLRSSSVGHRSSSLTLLKNFLFIWMSHLRCNCAWRRRSSLASQGHLQGHPQDCLQGHPCWPGNPPLWEGST